ncbi:MAG: hypothetical protein A2754_00470 [Candidatus Magasanikbacteria bacterium RIFCSPHIGHO2_01_FULL_47_8]|uniref:Uncharacterized protein n=1 Tax=Candidatus Magasanikbacteria bacterium RIFCSPHIGHO2_01_FULL_47_8 TaxID=1798673 RepID=A0A1F6MCE7_9BACT|nr:MAG: hypothetical protein A2754_00470 [Candidatus Magasanikbacteria bacterium RIFCSPHIGHO2_01_FULL_47_8]
MDRTKFTALKEKVDREFGTTSKVADKSAQEKKRLRILQFALEGLAGDWAQSAEDLAVRAIFCETSRWFFLKDDQDTSERVLLKDIFWAEEFVNDLEAARKGRPEKYRNSNKLVPVPLGHLNDAANRPCPGGEHTAQLVCHAHEEDFDEGFGVHFHFKKYLLCFECQTITPCDEKRCRGCLEVRIP